jgi:AraC family transcriptional regulator
MPQVQIVTFAETRVAAMEHRGDPTGLGATIRRFVAWRKQAGLSPLTHATFNIVYSGPTETAPADYRIDVCVALDRTLTPGDAGLVGKIIAGGRCAKRRHVGADGGLGDAVLALYRDWLPGSGEALRDAPLFFQRVTLPPFVPASEAITDIFLPLQ